MKRLNIVLATLLLASTAFAADAPSLTQRATSALFEDSDSRLAVQLATAALRHDRHDAEAAFVLMEASAMQADDSEVLDAALMVISELEASDARAAVALERIKELAANSATFRERMPRVQKLAHAVPELNLALVSAASDGVPELNQLEASREAGLLTDWRVAGPFGRNSLLDFDKHFDAEKDELRNRRSSNRTVEDFRFASGRFELPDYFSRRGVFYAASDVYVATDGMWNVFIETSGSAQVFLDGALVATRDERKPMQPELIRTLQHITRGRHRVLVKFTPSASPFRVALLPPTGGIRKKQNIPVLTASPESEYATASLELYRGNMPEAIAHAKAAQNMHESAATHWLLARCWRRVSEESPEQDAELRAALSLDPSSAALKLASSEQRLRGDHSRKGLALLKEVSLAAPRNERMLRDEAVEFSRLDWRKEAAIAFESLIAEHPSCSNLALAANFYASTEQLTEARRVEDLLGSCAPSSLDEAHALARRGDHTQAAQLALKIASSEALNREALAFAVSELMLTGDAAAAFPAARRLVELAPASTQYQSWANALARGETVLDNSQSAPLALLAAYRRDGLDVLRQTAAKKFSGGPATWPLNDAVLVEVGGTRWLYRHRIIRLLNRDGVLNYGEVSLPHGAEVLRLRTISASGDITEPDFIQHKATVSMPALAPGDSIEEEFLQKLSGEDTDFQFGSWDAPILLSRFTIIGPPELKATASPFAPASRQQMGNLIATTWESNDLPQPTREAALPSAPQFPFVLVSGEYDSIPTLREHAQEQLLGASVPGPRAQELARRLYAGSEQATARNIYRYVMRSVESDGSDNLAGDVTSAEDSLVGSEGNRVALLLALSRAAGLNVSLTLARNIGDLERPESFDHPVAIFQFSDGSSSTGDLVSEGLPLGAKDPTLDANAVPVISFSGESATMPAELTAALPKSNLEEKSVAEARVDVGSDGTLRADISIRMAPWRGAQMRSVLRNVSAPDRQRFYQQLAMRIFPGAGESSGSVVNENDSDQPLILKVTCSAPNFFDLRRRVVDVDQLTPALGLRSMYARSANRNYPLLIDSVLFESTLFKVNLPEGISFGSGMQTSVDSEFGDYSTSVRQISSHTWEMRRDFHIPVQIIQASQYAAFTSFATRIDNVERQRLSLRVDSRSTQPVRFTR